jgi:hypothetical protein
MVSLEFGVFQAGLPEAKSNLSLSAYGDWKTAQSDVMSRGNSLDFILIG